MIKNVKWSLYTPVNPPVENALYLRDADGNDWYENLGNFAETSYKIEHDEQGNIRRYNLDATQLFPVDLYISEVKSIPEDIDTVTYLFNGSRFSKPKIKNQDTIDRNNKIINSRLVTAGSIISSLKPLVDLGIADKQTEEKLELYINYVKDLMAIDRLKPEWPEEPKV